MMNKKWHQKVLFHSHVENKRSGDFYLSICERMCRKCAETTQRRVDRTDGRVV